jgi:hypothetical protein
MEQSGLTDASGSLKKQHRHVLRVAYGNHPIPELVRMPTAVGLQTSDEK